jgi:hypothetical protein
MNDLRCRSKNAQIAASIHNSTCGAALFQGSDRLINCESFGDSAKVDHQSPTKGDPVILAKKDVPPRCSAIKSIIALGKITPVCKTPSDRDIKRAVAFSSKLLGGFEHLPSPRVHVYALWKRPAVHSRNIAGGIMKTHEPLHFFNSGERRTDPALQTGRAGPGSCDFHKRAEQWAAATNFNA